MKKYRVESCSTDIKKVEVERETEVSVFIKGTRYQKVSEMNKFFDNFEDAKDNLLERCDNDRVIAKKRFRTAVENYNKVAFIVEGDT